MDDGLGAYLMTDMTIEIEWLPLPEWVPDPAQRHEVAKFPYDGAPILALRVWKDEEGNEHRDAQEAVWRVTRHYNGSEGAWKFTGFWVKRNAGGAKLGFEPDAFARLEA